MIPKIDELQKRICVESLSIAFLLTLVLTGIFVGLEHTGLHRPKWDDLGSYMMLLWACAYVFSVWKVPMNSRSFNLHVYDAARNPSAVRRKDAGRRKRLKRQQSAKSCLGQIV